ncbi:50S ribosomal protein L30 [Pseudomonadota bacterium]|jgi:large subunit ribosomal protein L30|nr:50S ribosomal protein L30 [Pseudomonadota bacterium]|tara:strand:- start:21 stop:206 length:186 start_codon:yes stop_codon:yes gene_type:complete
MNKKTMIKIKLVKSPIGRNSNHKLCVKGLGFKKLNQIVEIQDTQSNKGMINKISDMIEVVT